MDRGVVWGGCVSHYGWCLVLFGCVGGSWSYIRVLYSGVLGVISLGAACGPGDIFVGLLSFNIVLVHFGIPVALSRGDMLKLDRIVYRGGLKASWKPKMITNLRANLWKRLGRTTMLSMRAAWDS